MPTCRLDLSTVLLSASILLLLPTAYPVDAFLPYISPLPSHYFAADRRTPSTSFLFSSRRPLHDILVELRAKGIQFPPAATRSELEALLLSSREKMKSTSSSTREVSDTYYSRPPTKDPVERTNVNSPSRSSSSTDHQERGSRKRRIQRSELDDYYTINGGSTDRDLRRRRRQRRQQQRPVSATDAILRVVNKTSRTVAQAIPEQVVEIGNKATRIATRKTQKLFEELVDLTYDDDDLETSPQRASGRSRKRRPAQVDPDDEQRAPYGGEGPQQVDSIPKEEHLRRRGKRERREPSTSYSSAQSNQRRSGSPTLRNEWREDPLTESTPSVPLTSTKIPIGEILSELDSRNVRYSPQATRLELEELLERSKGIEESETESPTSQNDVSPSSTDNEPRHDGFYREEKNSHQESIWRKASRVAAKKVQSVPREIKDHVQNKARNTYRNAKSGVSGLFQNNAKLENSVDGETPIIVDAVVEDISMSTWDDDDVIDAQPYRESRYRRRTPRPNPTGKGANNEQTTTSGAARGAFRSRVSRTGSVQTKRADRSATARKMQEEINSEISLRLSPAIAGSAEEYPPRTDRQKRATAAGRRIYSPYQKVDPEGSYDFVDGLDQLGDYVAKSVDSFLWGVEHDDGTRQSKKRSAQTTSRSGTRRRSGHWKDRMEEQFDYLMGIHKDGKYYSRWVDQEQEDERSVEGTDAVSYARGRAPRPGSRRRMYERPIWEEEDSLLGMLFGTDKQAHRQNDSLYAPGSIIGSGSLVKVLQALLRSSALVVSGVCRWASVRGSLPQPIVVVGVLSAALSARPGVRIRSIFLALLVLRTAGELLHGYMYDDADFWEPEENESIPRPQEEGSRQN